MRFLLALPFFFSLSAHAEKLLDCNIGFGEIAQIQIFDERGDLTYKLLTSSGRWLPNTPLERGMWTSRELRFEYRGDKYKFFSTNGGRGWRYEISSFSREPHTIGGADCD